MQNFKERMECKNCLCSVKNSSRKSQPSAELFAAALNTYAAEVIKRAFYNHHAQVTEVYRQPNCPAFDQ